MATTVTTELETRNVAMNVSNDFELIFTKPFFDNEEYINAMVNSIRPYVENKSYDKIIFKYDKIISGFQLAYPYNLFCPLLIKELICSCFFFFCIYR